MSLRYALLAGLALEPRSGYDLARWFGETASYYWSATHSSIYPALAALEEERLVAHTVVPSEKGPARKVYRLTLLGHDALLAWLDAPASPPVVRDEEALKALCYGLLPPDRARAQLEGARARHAANLAHYKEQARGLEREADGRGDAALVGNEGDGDRQRHSPAARLGLLLALRRGIDVEKGYVAWCDEAVAAVAAAAQPPPPAEAPRRKGKDRGKDKDRDKRGKKKHRDR